MPSTGGESRKPSNRPSFKTETAALEEISFLLRDLEKRMRVGDVEGVHDGARELAATADNLWKVGFKKLDDRGRMTLNGYMNLLKNEAGELESFQGKEDLEDGRKKLARLKEIFSLVRKQFYPDTGPDSSSASQPAAPPVRPPADSGTPTPGKNSMESEKGNGGY